MISVNVIFNGNVIKQMEKETSFSFYTMVMMMVVVLVGCMGAMVKVIPCQEEKINGCVSVRTVQRESRDCDFHQGDHHHDLDEFYPVFERLVIAIIMPLVKITSCLFQLW